MHVYTELFFCISSVNWYEEQKGYLCWAETRVKRKEILRSHVITFSSQHLLLRIYIHTSEHGARNMSVQWIIPTNFHVAWLARRGTTYATCWNRKYSAKWCTAVHIRSSSGVKRTFWWGARDIWGAVVSELWQLHTSCSDENGCGC